MVEVVGVFSYFSCFPDYAGMVGADVWCDFSSVEVDAVISPCKCLATADHWFSSMLCSEILVEML
jgi:hypothetical protein